MLWFNLFTRGVVSDCVCCYNAVAGLTAYMAGWKLVKHGASPAAIGSS